MKVIVGLGNPGRQYASTRHNIGFMVVDELADRWGCAPFVSRFRGLVTEARMEGQKVLLLKPETFMNLSGEAVGEAVRFFKVDPKDILVIHDDLDLPPGRLRGREKGRSGGHNGLKSLIAHLGGENFPRLKMGIGRPVQGSSAAFVLQNFAVDEAEVVETMIGQACQAAELWVRQGMLEVMNRFNREGEPPKNPSA
ncbi:aminoacyl-tRNA hydrolase [Heliophilum fasciatum]|uniref:Peptidyl-tRNA hydrolase n=1 Tax=Heliophilum fasciatum TaxID=35700 RepID=A0A4R2S7S2_9FIRM|nr:aminoacyl-tRNA hydrolase [Heliophilum fasciatum]MCW2277023.1 PTH1 family peptidyl-tRNA hydrolase [Heliophilum fasciatum]TCP68451.1 peptidyl-tRNA hydrolase [Heliophilum fasciatum]